MMPYLAFAAPQRFPAAAPTSQLPKSALREITFGDSTQIPELIWQQRTHAQIHLLCPDWKHPAIARLACACKLKDWGFKQLIAGIACDRGCLDRLAGNTPLLRQPVMRSSRDDHCIAMHYARCASLTVANTPGAILLA